MDALSIAFVLLYSLYGVLSVISALDAWWMQAIVLVSGWIAIIHVLGIIDARYERGEE